MTVLQGLAAYPHQEPSNTPGRLQGLVKLYNTPLTARGTQDGKHVKHVACWLVKLDLQPLWTAKTVLSKWRVTLLLIPPSAPFSSSTTDLTFHVTSSPYLPHGPMIVHALTFCCFPPSTYLFNHKRYLLQLIFYMKEYLAVFRRQKHAKADFFIFRKINQGILFTAGDFKNLLLLARWSRSQVLRFHHMFLSFHHSFS